MRETQRIRCRNSCSASGSPRITRRTSSKSSRPPLLTEARSSCDAGSIEGFRELHFLREEGDSRQANTGLVDVVATGGARVHQVLGENSRHDPRDAERWCSKT